MDQLFTKEITDKLPTLDHYKQICYSLSVRRKNIHPYDDFDISIINTIITIEDIQIYIFNILNENVLSHRGVILSEINYYLKTFRFYIAPNTYTSTLTLKQFFHCIDIKYYSNASHIIDTCTYKYNIFYKGEKFDNVYDHRNDYIIIDKRFISCKYIGVTEGKDDNDFKNLPIEHFTILLKIMGKEYACTIASYENDYICKYWEDKDIEVLLDYIMKGRRYYYVDCCNNYIKCILEKNIQNNNYTQEKLLPLYLKYDNKVLAVQTDPLAICYTNITKILKKYIKFPVVRLGFDTEAVQTITPTSTDTKVDITPSTVAIAAPTIKSREIDGYRKIQLMIDIANEELFKKLFEKDSVSKDTETIKVDFATGQKKTNEVDGYKKIQLMLNTANEKLFEKIQIELAKNNTIFEALNEENAALKKENAELQETNAALKERTKILDESNF
jgi:hypothetical protein